MYIYYELYINALRILREIMLLSIGRYTGILFYIVSSTWSGP